jgi:hypothetical protein
MFITAGVALVFSPRQSLRCDGYIDKSVSGSQSRGCKWNVGPVMEKSEVVVRMAGRPSKHEES